MEEGTDKDVEKVEKKRLRQLLRRGDINACCRLYWLQRFPMLTWIRTYNVYFFINDLIAGITVGLTAIPQGVAYAVVAGLTPEFGLYSGYMACFVYFFLGTVKQMTIGPTAIMALMVHDNVSLYNSDFAVLNCFLAGCIIFLLGILRMGFLVNFISLPVTVGFTMAAALTIGASQLNSLFGIPGRAREFLPALISFFQDITKTKFADLSLGIGTIIFLAVMKTLNEKIAYKQGESISSVKPKNVYVGIVRFIALGRNGVVVIFGALLAYILDVYGMSPFTLTEEDEKLKINFDDTGEVDEGFPTPRPPPFSTDVTQNNQTIHLSFVDMIEIIGTKVVSIPLTSILETIAIGKIFAKGEALDAGQEMIALGMSNILSSFLRSMPIAGSFTRSVVNNASGVKTPLGGLFTAILVISAMSITSTFEYIPKASLAGVILNAMYHMFNFQEFIFIWRVNRLDMIPFWATILFCLAIRVDVGMFLGIIVNLFFLLYVNLKPRTEHEELTIRDKEVILVRLNQTPLYSGAEHVRNLIMKNARFRTKALVVIDGSRLTSTDSTTIKTFKVLGENLQKHTEEYALWNWPPKFKELSARVSEEFAAHYHNTETIQELIEIMVPWERREEKDADVKGVDEISVEERPQK